MTGGVRRSENPVYAFFKKSRTLLGRAQQLWELLCCGFKGKSVVRKHRIHRSSQVNEPREGKQEIIHVEACYQLDVYCASAKAREKEPPRFAVTSPLTVQVRSKVIDTAEFEGFVSSSDSTTGQVGHELTNGRGIVPCTSAAMRQVVFNARNTMYEIIQKFYFISNKYFGKLSSFHESV